MRSTAAGYSGLVDDLPSATRYATRLMFGLSTNLTRRGARPGSDPWRG